MTPKEAKTTVRRWLAGERDGPCPEVIPALQLLAIEELILVSDPLEIDAYVETLFVTLRREGKLREAALRSEIASLLEARTPAVETLIIGTGEWHRSWARTMDFADQLDSLVFHCANQLAAWCVFANLTAVACADWRWPGLLLPRVAATKLATRMGRPTTEEKLNACIDAIIEEARLASPNFHYAGVGEAIGYFQNRAFWMWNTRRKSQGNLEFERLPEDWELRENCETPLARAKRLRREATTRRDLWARLAPLAPGDRLLCWVLAILVEFEARPVTWEQAANGIQELLDGVPARVPFNLPNDYPPGHTREDALSAFREMAAKARKEPGRLNGGALKVFYSRCLKRLHG